MLTPKILNFDFLIFNFMLDIHPDEKMMLKVRRHKLVLILETLFLIFFIIIPPVMFIVLERNLTIQGSDTALFIGIYSAILLIAWIIFFIIWTNYYLDVLIVTDKRIIDIEQKGFFKREVSTLRLDNIQDVSVNISGILATFLDFGTIRIQSAGEMPEFIINDIPKPNRVKATIYELHKKMVEAPQSVKVIQ